MIRDEDVAAKVSQALQDAFNRLGESMLEMNNGGSQAEKELYRRKIGDIFYIIVFDLLEPLYKDHPKLKPVDWDDRKL